MATPSQALDDNTSQPDKTSTNTQNLTTIAQSTPHTTTPSGQTSTVTTTGNIVQSSDPSTNPDASISQKLTGDLKGAVSGTMGSLQAATGAAMGKKEMEEKGLDKMAQEDERLGAKRGVMPVGADKREGTEDVKGEGSL